MNTIRQRIASKPFTYVSLAAFFGATAATAAFREDWLPYLAGAYVVGILVMVFSIMWKWTTPVLLAIAIVIPDAKAEEPSVAEGAAGVAVVVVVVGGVTVYLLVKTCQRLFPKTPSPSTNSPPEVIGDVDSAASWTYSAWVSCYEPQSDQQWPQVTMELSGVIDQNEDGPFFNLTASRRLNRTEDSLDYIEFQHELARHGIGMGPVGTMCFGRNGRPAEEQETPIRFFESGNEHLAAVYSDTSPSVPMVVQRSFDLKSWTDFGYVSVPIRQQFKLIDSTTRQSCFYRIQPKP